MEEITLDKSVYQKVELSKLVQQRYQKCYQFI